MTSIGSESGVLGRAAKRELLKLFALAPVRRGEGKGEGAAPQMRRARDGRRSVPLTLAPNESPPNI